MHRADREAKIKGRGAMGKTVVQGVLERGGRVIAGVVKNTRRSTIQPNIRNVVEDGSTIYSDDLKSYRGLADKYFHDTVNHAVEYVRGDCHTNGMENFWSLLKRCFKGTYIHAAPGHLSRYVDEEAFRFNERKKTDSQRFDEVMSRVVGLRLQYAELTQ
jgi:transposase-like protein